EGVRQADPGDRLMSARELKLGDRMVKLRFSILAFEALQEHYKVDSIDAVGHRLQDAGAFGVDDLVAIFHAATRSNHPDLTKDELKVLIDKEFDLTEAADMKRLTDAMSGVIADGMPKDADEETP
ncbi:MAG TPA: protein S100, partial [Alphaproteobacteria bacterium]|nr:protein S100 [Alphaproteobacteria bacterium]